MNEPPSRPRRPSARRRVAASTAAAIGAALLAAPGAASAQDTETDCAALGDDPTATGLESALEAAHACQVEVRIEDRSSPYATVYVTPQNQLHYVATAAPVQGRTGAGTPDPALVAADGVLAAASTDWPFLLPYDGGAELPLLDTPYTELYWDGETPVPAHSGTTAVYEELAPGLDLTVDVDVAAADLRFTAADPTAWETLAGGLAVDPEDSAYITTRGSVSVRADTDYAYSWEVEATTPFIVRDAAGTVTAAELDQDYDTGALTVSVPEDALAAAAFPLELSAQWAYRAFPVPGWGSVTSAADLALYRGEGGFDEPYFAAAGETGDALAGAYCDALADATCATQAQAASYWSFPWPMIESLRATAPQGFAYPVASASFQIDAADAAECRSPDLYRSTGHNTTTTWSHRPNTTGDAAPGTCRDGTAAYDVTAMLEPVWSDNDRYASAHFAMTGGAATARFDGGSARLDVYFDIVGYLFSIPSSSCGTASSPDYHRSEVTGLGGDHRVETWRPDLIDLEFTWTAEVYDAHTGELLLAPDPQDAPDGSRPSVRLAADEALGAGRLYRAEYTLASATTGLSVTKTCYFGVDTDWPDVDGVDVEPGPHYLGDTVAVDVAVSDDAFPNGWSELNVDCYGGDMCDGVDSVALRDDTTASFDLELGEGFNTAVFNVTDEAGQYGMSDSLYINATANVYDYDGDRYQDLYMVRETDGALLFYGGEGDGTFAAPVSRGTGWGGRDIVMAGDLTEDGVPDLLARDARTGNLYTYPGDGDGGFEARIAVGSGWNAVTTFSAAADFDGDGLVDLHSIRKDDGRLHFHPGEGDGTFGARVAVDSPTEGNGWDAYDSMITISPRGNESQADLLLHDAEHGSYQVLESDGNGGVEDSTAALSMGTRRSDGSQRTYARLAPAGDQNADGREDFVAVDAKTGELLLLTGGENTMTATVLSPLGGAFRVPAAGVDEPYDYDGDLAPDLYGVRSGSSDLRFYPGTGNGSFGSSRYLGFDLGDMTLVETAGDMTGDGVADLLIRFEGGLLELLPGDGDGDFVYSPVVTVGTGWHRMSAVVSGHDYDGDGKVDIIAREASTGYLWLYPGEGDGTVGSRTRIGTGWNAMREITAVGDLDHDGIADLIASRVSDGCMYFYAGKGAGGVANGVKLGCGWGGMDALAAVGDFDGDGHNDFTARRKSDGALFLYRGKGTGNFLSSVQVGTGWNAMDIIA